MEINENLRLQTKLTGRVRLHILFVQKEIMFSQYFKLSSDCVYLRAQIISTRLWKLQSDLNKRENDVCLILTLAAFCVFTSSVGSGWSSGGSGGALSVVGETLQQVAQARDTLDVNVKHSFIDPLQDLHNTELKDIRVRGRSSSPSSGCRHDAVGIIERANVSLRWKLQTFMTLRTLSLYTQNASGTESEQIFWSKCSAAVCVSDLCSDWFFSTS